MRCMCVVRCSVFLASVLALGAGCAPKVVAVHIQPDRIEVELDRPSRAQLSLVSTDATRVVPLEGVGAVQSSRLAADVPRGDTAPYLEPFHVARTDRPRGYLRPDGGTDAGRATFVPSLWARAPGCVSSIATMTGELPKLTGSKAAATAPALATCQQALPHEGARVALAGAVAAMDGWRAARTARTTAETELAAAQKVLADARATVAAETTREARLRDAIPRDPNFVGGVCTRPSWTRTPKPPGACWPDEVDDYKGLCVLRELDDYACIALAERILGPNREGLPAWTYSCDDLIEEVDGGTGEFSEVADRALALVVETALDVPEDEEVGFFEALGRTAAFAAALYKKHQLCEQAVERACTRRFTRWDSGEDSKRDSADRAYSTCQANVTGAADAAAKRSAAARLVRDTEARLPTLEAALHARQQADDTAATRAWAAIGLWRTAAGEWTAALSDGPTYRAALPLTAGRPEQYLDADGARREW